MDNFLFNATTYYISLLWTNHHSTYRVRIADHRALRGSLRYLDSVQRAAVTVKEHPHAVLQQRPVCCSGEILHNHEA